MLIINGIKIKKVLWADETREAKVFIFRRRDKTKETDSKLVQLKLTDVLWVEALGNYVRVNTNEEKFTVLTTMKEIESKLSNKEFVRVQRSFIVRIDKINSIEDNYIIINDKEIHIGKSYKEEFSKKLNIL